MPSRRRTILDRKLAAALLVLSVSLAGCTLGDEEEAEDGGEPTPGTTPVGTPTPTTPPPDGGEPPGPMENLSMAAGLVFPAGVELEVVTDNLTFPSSIEWDDAGNMYTAISLGPQRGIYRVHDNGSVEPVLTNASWTPQLLDITWHDGWMYFSTTARVHRANLTTGEEQIVIEDLPAWGDHRTNEIAFGPDGRLYVGQGTVTNSGVVGLDQAGAPNAIVDIITGGPGEGEGTDGGDDRAVSAEELRQTHDIPCEDVQVSGVNYETANPLAQEIDFDTYIGAARDVQVLWYNSSEEIPENASGINGTRVTTGPYAPFGTPRYRGETVDGDVRCNGSVLSANPDGSDLRVVAWGFRNPFGVGFDADGNLWVTNNGYDKRGSRPVGATPDELYRVDPAAGGEAGVWYGWADYSASIPVTDDFYLPPYGAPVHPVLLAPPNEPPPPDTFFAAHSSADKFDFAPEGTAWAGDMFVAEFGSLGYSFANGALAGMAVTRVHMDDGAVTQFVWSDDRWSGDFRPVEARFGPDGRLYVVDFGDVSTELLPEEEAKLFNQSFVPGTGRILAFTLPSQSDFEGRPVGSIGGRAWEPANVSFDDPPENATEIRAFDYGFGVAQGSVRAGDAIVFRNTGDVGHTATAYDGTFNTGFRFARNETATWTPEQPGTYRYFCMVHPVMVGEIVVEAAT